MLIDFFKQSQSLRKILFKSNNLLTENNILSYSSEQIDKLLSKALLDNSIFSSSDSSDIQYENDIFSYVEENDENNTDITDLLNDLLQNESVIELIDADGNGKLKSDEVNAFMDAVKSLDENPDDISVYDIFSALQSIENGTFIQEETNETADVAESSAANEKVNSNRKTGSAGNTGSYGGNSGLSGNTSTDNPAVKDSSKNINNMSLEELQSQKTEQESALQTAQNNVKDVYAGETSAIKSAQDDCDAKKQAYEEALENDENISDELKTKQQTNQTQIDSQKSLISQVKSDIFDKESQISAQEAVINSDESNISALESAISKLTSQKSDDKSVKADINSQLSSAKSQLSSAQTKLKNDKAALTKYETEKSDLEERLASEEEKLDGFEIERADIEAEILANCGDETKAALEAFKFAEANVEAIKQDELSIAEEAVTAAQSKLDEINAAINTKQAKNVESEYSVNDLGNPEQLYKSMGLEEQGLNYEVFLSAIEGYNNLDDALKSTGYLGIFDTTQSSDKERYYLLDLNNFEVVGRTVLKTGSGNMDDVESANKGGSHATLSGFEQVAEEYYSSSMGKNALRLDGLEEGINDNARAKGTVVHYTVNENTWGCKGFTPVRVNGKIDMDATYRKMRELFPTGSIIYTQPTDSDYWKLSDLYA